MKIRWDKADKLSKGTAACSCSLDGGRFPFGTQVGSKVLHGGWRSSPLPRKEPPRKHKETWNPQHGGKVIVGGLPSCFSPLWLCRVFSSSGDRGLPSRCGAHAFPCGGLSCCGAWVLGWQGSVVVAHWLSCPLACGILVPRAGMEPSSPALAGGFLTAGPPANYLSCYFSIHGSLFCLILTGPERYPLSKDAYIIFRLQKVFIHTGLKLS